MTKAQRNIVKAMREESLFQQQRLIVEEIGLLFPEGLPFERMTEAEAKDLIAEAYNKASRDNKKIERLEEIGRTLAFLDLKDEILQESLKF